MKILKAAFGAYQNFLVKFPIGSQAIQTGLLMGVGDIISQTVVEKHSIRDIDRWRLITFSGIGLCVVGPTVRVWYGVLDKYVKGHALKKVALDQLVFAPSFNLIVLPLIGLSRGLNFEEIKEDLRAKYVDIMVTNYQVWPAIQFINFSFVPLNYQVLVVQVCAIAWNTYISWKTHQEL